MTNRKKISGREGFTLVEVMLVLFILMTLASVGMLAVRNFRKQANINTARMELGNLASLLEHYEGNIGNFPSSDEGLNALCECPASVDQTVWFKVATWNTPPTDPWGMQYNYQYPGSSGNDTFDLWSNGPDGQSGTDDDIWYGK